MVPETRLGEELLEGQYRLLVPVSAEVAPEDTGRRLRTAVTIARSDEYDVTVLGSPTSGLLSQFVFSTVPDSVNQRTENVVVMAQPDTGSTSVYDRWVAGDPTE